MYESPLSRYGVEAALVWFQSVLCLETNLHFFCSFYVQSSAVFFRGYTTKAFIADCLAVCILDCGGRDIILTKNLIATANCS